MARNKKSKNLEIGYHAITFLDLMGQQSKLRNIGDLPKDRDGPEFDELLDSLKLTYGAIEKLRATFRSYFNGYSKRTISAKDFPVWPKYSCGFPIVIFQ